MRKVWVIVANSTISKIYRAESVENLVIMQTFEHEESHLPGRDLVSDKQGRMTQRGVFGSDTYQEPTPLKVKEAHIFALQISKFIEEAYNNKEFERLYLISKPPFLSHLRDAFSDQVSKSIQAEVHKDLTQMKPHEIREYLPPVL